LAVRRNIPRSFATVLWGLIYQADRTRFSQLAAAVASSARPAARTRSRVREVRSRSIFKGAGDVYRVLSSCVSWCTR
jgi:hypothetical protein